MITSRLFNIALVALAAIAFSVGSAQAALFKKKDRKVTLPKSLECFEVMRSGDVFALETNFKKYVVKMSELENNMSEISRWWGAEGMNFASAVDHEKYEFSVQMTETGRTYDYEFKTRDILSKKTFRGKLTQVFEGETSQPDELRCVARF